MFKSDWKSEVEIEEGDFVVDRFRVGETDSYLSTEFTDEIKNKPRTLLHVGSIKQLEFEPIIFDSDYDQKNKAEVILKYENENVVLEYKIQNSKIIDSENRGFKRTASKRVKLSNKGN